MPFIFHATVVEFARRMRKMVYNDISFESHVIGVINCCLSHQTKSIILKRELDAMDRDLDLKVQLRSKRLFGGWHHIKIFVVPPAKRFIVYAVTQMF